MVALGDAWQTGAQQISEPKREELANDPLNLQSTDGPTNEQKGDADAASWLPPNKSYRCTYVSRQIDVKAKYALWVTPAEHDAMATVLHGCGGTVTVVTTTAAPPRTSTTKPAPQDHDAGPAAEAVDLASPATAQRRVLQELRGRPRRRQGTAPEGRAGIPGRTRPRRRRRGLRMTRTRTSGGAGSGSPRAPQRRPCGTTCGVPLVAPAPCSIPSEGPFGPSPGWPACAIATLHRFTRCGVLARRGQGPVGGTDGLGRL